jgi:integrase
MALDAQAVREGRVVADAAPGAAQTRYLPIAEHGLIGDLHTVALVGTDGTPYSPDYITRAFGKAVKKAGLPKLTPHGLRHTWATLGLPAGVPLKVVSERLGHSSVAFTADRYQHVTPGMQEDAAAKVAALVGLD